ncbi:hypothetical protein T484DRAFT_1848647 [Baffinella frigidus]|nr:hypothetical protein T484DRAFT_1848647 [Cryptophyta sp. CCMP2293]
MEVGASAEKVPAGTEHEHVHPFRAITLRLRAGAPPTSSSSSSSSDSSDSEDEDAKILAAKRLPAPRGKRAPPASLSGSSSSEDEDAQISKGRAIPASSPSSAAAPGIFAPKPLPAPRASLSNLPVAPTPDGPVAAEPAPLDSAGRQDALRQGAALALSPGLPLLAGAPLDSAGLDRPAWQQGQAGTLSRSVSHSLSRPASCSCERTDIPRQQSVAENGAKLVEENPET